MFWKKKKYEFYILEESYDYPYYNDRINKESRELQDNGWELAGSIGSFYHDSPTNKLFVFIPFKRKIK